MSSMIKSRNKKVINKDVKESKPCNCRVKSEYPLNGQCEVTDIIHKCTVISPDKPNKVYLGTAEGDFKKHIKFQPDSSMAYCRKGTASF